MSSLATHSIAIDNAGKRIQKYNDFTLYITPIAQLILIYVYIL